MIVTFPLEFEQQVKTQAAQRGMDVASYLLSLVQRDSKAAAPANDTASDYDPDALNRMIAKLTSRTPEEKLAARQRAIAESRPQIELAPDASFFDVIPAVRGDETDEEAIASLKEFSLTEVRKIISEIDSHLTQDDDPVFWAIATYTLLGDTFHFMLRDFDTHNIFIQLGACSHWLRPHQTRLTAAGGFALPAGYGGSGQSREGLPEYDWSILIHWDISIGEWVLTDKFFGKKKLTRRIALPTRTARHNQAAVHAIWTPGSPRHPNQKRVDYYGFRKINGVWRCVLPTDVEA